MFWLGGLGEFGLGECLVFLICLFLFDILIFWSLLTYPWLSWNYVDQAGLKAMDTSTPECWG